jgi:hypothetical protein
MPTIDRTAFDASKQMVDFNPTRAVEQAPPIMERRRGIRVWDAFGRDWIDIAPPFLITESEASEIVEIISSSLKDVAA